MKCPECDLEQPDNTAICAKCGLSFEAWHTHNPEASKPAPAPDPGMTFPVREEEEPDPQPEEEPVPPEQSDSGEISTPDEVPKETTENPPSAVKKSFKWTPLHFTGLGFITLAILTAFICARRNSPPPPAGIPSPLTTPDASPGSSITPNLGSPTVFTPPLVTPENSLLPATPTPALPAVPATQHKKNSDPAITQEDHPAVEKSAVGAKDGPVTMEMPSDDSAANSPASPTETPSPVPASGAKDLLESSEPVTVSTPAATP